MPRPNTDPKRHALHDAARAAATDVARTLQRAGHTAYFAGGCVRDDLLGLDPIDYDVATNAKPDQITRLFPSTSEVGAHFGVVLVHANNNDQRLHIEVATFRADGPYSDNRRPDDITFADEIADAHRRDFTINALFIDPLAVGEGPLQERVIDHVGGVHDLKQGLIKAVGDPEARLAEDHLRALRAIRFAARLGFRIDEDTAEAIRKHAKDLNGVSRERIGQELRRIMADPYRSVAIWQLQYLGLDAPVFNSANINTAPRTLGRLADDATLPTCLAALALDRGLTELTQVAGLVQTWRDALCLSNEERDEFKETLEGLGLLERAWPDLSVAEQKRAASAPWFTEALRLVAARDLEHMVRIRMRVNQLAATPSGLAPAPLIDGEALIARGHRPGPAFGDVLERVYDAQLRDEVATEADALALADRLLADNADASE